MLVLATTYTKLYPTGKLYLPEEWLQVVLRCQAVGIFHHTVFQTKPQLVQGMLAVLLPTRSQPNGLSPTLCIAAMACASGYRHILVCVGDTMHLRVWEGGQQVSVAALMETVVAQDWVCLSVGDGSQCPRYYEWAWMQLPYAVQPFVPIGLSPVVA